MRLRTLFVTTIVVGIVSFCLFGLERLALTDIFHGESDLRLEWMVANAALVPGLLFHVLGIVTVSIGLKRLGPR